MPLLAVSQMCGGKKDGGYGLSQKLDKPHIRRESRGTEAAVLVFLIILPSAPVFFLLSVAQQSLQTLL